MANVSVVLDVKTDVIASTKKQQNKRMSYGSGVTGRLCRFSMILLSEVLRTYPKRIRTHLACRFSAALRYFPLPYDSMPAEKRLDPLEIRQRNLLTSYSGISSYYQISLDKFRHISYNNNAVTIK